MFCVDVLKNWVWLSGCFIKMIIVCVICFVSLVFKFFLMRVMVRFVVVVILVVVWMLLDFIWICLGVR